MLEGLLSSSILLLENIEDLYILIYPKLFVS
nr:MAG TPA: hypothetical protein [Bacteriophage sp.]